MIAAILNFVVGLGLVAGGVEVVLLGLYVFFVGWFR